MKAWRQGGPDQEPAALVDLRGQIVAAVRLCRAVGFAGDLGISVALSPCARRILRTPRDLSDLSPEGLELTLAPATAEAMLHRHDPAARAVIRLDRVLVCAPSLPEALAQLPRAPWADAGAVEGALREAATAVPG